MLGPLRDFCGEKFKISEIPKASNGGLTSIFEFLHCGVSEDFCLLGCFAV